MFSFVTLILIRSFDVAVDEDDDDTGEDDADEEEPDDFVGSLLDKVLSNLDGPAIIFIKCLKSNNIKFIFTNMHVDNQKQTKNKCT